MADKNKKKINIYVVHNGLIKQGWCIIDKTENEPIKELKRLKELYGKKIAMFCCQTDDPSVFDSIVENLGEKLYGKTCENTCSLLNNLVRSKTGMAKGHYITEEEDKKQKKKKEETDDEEEPIEEKITKKKKKVEEEEPIEEKITKRKKKVEEEDVNEKEDETDEEKEKKKKPKRKTSK
jgi:hypothetical protein